MNPRHHKLVRARLEAVRDVEREGVGEAAGVLHLPADGEAVEEDARHLVGDGDAHRDAARRKLLSRSGVEVRAVRARSLFPGREVPLPDPLRFGGGDEVVAEVGGDCGGAAREREPELLRRGILRYEPVRVLLPARERAPQEVEPRRHEPALRRGKEALAGFDSHARGEREPARVVEVDHDELVQGVRGCGAAAAARCRGLKLAERLERALHRTGATRNDTVVAVHALHLAVRAHGEGDGGVRAGGGKFGRDYFRRGQPLEPDIRHKPRARYDPLSLLERRHPERILILCHQKRRRSGEVVPAQVVRPLLEELCGAFRAGEARALERRRHRLRREHPIRKHGERGRRVGPQDPNLDLVHPRLEAVRRAEHARARRPLSRRRGARLGHHLPVQHHVVELAVQEHRQRHLRVRHLVVDYAERGRQHVLARGVEAQPVRVRHRLTPSGPWFGAPPNLVTPALAVHSRKPVRINFADLERVSRIVDARGEERGGSGALAVRRQTQRLPLSVELGAHVR
mmetsp:Transcript_26634/g.87331  ORF Transcript_26634/g.87331 Transcript_26634/m.87331 type:complete len:514 (-) Transcript_26634:136-1677(-)